MGGYRKLLNFQRYFDRPVASGIWIVREEKVLDRCYFGKCAPMEHRCTQLASGLVLVFSVSSVVVVA